MTRVVTVGMPEDADAKERGLPIDGCPRVPSKLFWAGRPAMRVVQALRWLKDTLPADRDRIMTQLAAILTDRRHGKAIRDDLRAGFATLPAWMQEIVRTLLSAHADRSYTPVRRPRRRAAAEKASGKTTVVRRR